MSVRRGPTERRRSEGIPTKEEPNQEQAPLVTWGAFPSNSPEAKCLPLGRPFISITTHFPGEAGPTENRKAPIKNPA